MDSLRLKSEFRDDEDAGNIIPCRWMHETGKKNQQIKPNKMFNGFCSWGQCRSNGSHFFRDKSNKYSDIGADKKTPQRNSKRYQAKIKTS